jgi:hypothetical protein
MGARGPKPGHKTGGRAKGTPNKITKALKDMILGALDDAGGQAYLTTQAKDNPAAFMALIGRVLPTNIADETGEPLRIVAIERVMVPLPTYQVERLGGP